MVLQDGGLLDWVPSLVRPFAPWEGRDCAALIVWRRRMKSEIKYYYLLQVRTSALVRQEEN